MTTQPRKTLHEENDPLEAALKQQLSEIAREQTPERLLSLARELQGLLRKRKD